MKSSSEARSSSASSSLKSSELNFFFFRGFAPDFEEEEAFELRLEGFTEKSGHLRVGPEYVGDVLALAPGQCSTPFTILFFILEPTIGGLILIILVILFCPGRLFSVGRRICLLVLVEAGRLDQLVVLLKEVVDGLPRARLAQLQPRAAKVIHVDHLLLLAALLLLAFFLLANEILRANVTVAELPLLPCGQLLRLQALKLLAQADVLEVEAFDEKGLQGKNRKKKKLKT
ncbi:hypothetical protein TYRP_006144 [Tyrophagus putrescentiae]|nr:hypothetical protein TYRP_006144 [Tyrophagus putrescentiae]